MSDTPPFAARPRLPRFGPRPVRVETVSFVELQSSPRTERSGDPGSIFRPFHLAEPAGLGPGSGAGATISGSGRGGDWIGGAADHDKT